MYSYRAACCRCGAEVCGCLRNPDLSHNLPPRGLEQTSRRLLRARTARSRALGSLPEIGALKERDAKRDRGLQEENWCLLSFCTRCMLIVEQSELLIILLQPAFHLQSF